MILRRALFLNNIRRLTCQWRRMSFHAHYRYTHRPSLYRQNTFIFIRYELHVVHCNDDPHCVDCILLRTDIRHANGGFVTTRTTSKMKKKRKDCRLIYVYLRIPMQTRTKNILLKRRNIRV